MAPRRSFLDADEVDDLAAEAGLIERSSEPRQPLAPVRFAYAGASQAVSPVDGTSQWVTSAIAADGRDPELSPRLLRLRGTRPPGVDFVATDAFVDWVLSCAEGSRCLILAHDNALLANFGFEPATIEACRRMVAAARPISERRQGVSLVIPVDGGVLRLCWPGAQADGISVAFLCESDPGDAFSDELGAIIGTITLKATQSLLSAPAAPEESSVTFETKSAVEVPAEVPTEEASKPDRSTVLVPFPDGDDFAELSEGHDDEEPAAEEPAEDGVLIDDLLDLIDASAAPRWALLRVALRTRCDVSRLRHRARFSDEERELLRHAVGRVLVMELP